MCDQNFKGTGMAHGVRGNNERCLKWRARVGVIKEFFLKQFERGSG